jgi:N-acetylmuramoyl-L-alanine amidase
MVSERLIRKNGKTAVLCLLGLAFLLSIFIPILTAQGKDVAGLFEEAEAQYKKFIQDTKRHIYPERWEECLNRYREIVILGRDTEYVDDAAYMVAYIYFRMFERFSNQAYMTSAINSFNFLFSRYPDSAYIEKALYYTGFINYKYRNDRESARNLFDKLIERYPKGKYAEDAKKLLDDIARAGVIHVPSGKGGFSVLNDLRYWSSPDYTRVVIYFNNPVPFENHRIYDPDRIYFDFEDTRISKQIAEWMLTIEDNFLKRVRIGHYNPKTTRVVLDLEKVGKYNIFSLVDPFRIVIDITGSGFDKAAADTAVSSKTPDKTADAGSNTNGADVKSGTPPDSKDAKNDSSGDKKSMDSGKPDTGYAGQTSKSPVTVIPLRNSSGNYSIVRQLGLGVATIVLDPGHGGKDPGVVFKKSVYEKDLVLDFALRMKSILEKDGKYQVYMTRDSDVYLPLEERTARAMQYKADLFISLHMNSNRSSSLGGLEVYYLGFATDRQTEALAAQENSVSQKSIGELQEILKLMIDAKVEESKDLAQIISMGVLNHMKKDYSSFRTRGIRQAPFIVLIGASMPSLLVELGYLTNQSESKNLLNPVYRQKLAESLAKGLEDYIQNLNGKFAER